MPHGKACTCCQRLLLAEHFRPVAAMRDGLDSWCKDCQRRSTRQWRAANRGRENAARRKPRAVMRCEHCGTAFETARKDQRYCGQRCRSAAKRARSEPRTCAACGSRFVPSDSRATHCSVACSKLKPCVTCGLRMPKPNRHAQRCIACHAAHSRARRHAKAAARLGRTIGKPRHWYAGTCIHCGQGFIDNQPDRNVCSPRCGRRYSASIRRARKRAAFVEQVVRPKVYARDGWRCQLCGQPVQRDKVVPHPDAPTLDHIVPLAAGGDHSYANTQLAHFRCNYLKGDRGGGEQLRLVA
jgi:hypothetical protein